MALNLMDRSDSTYSFDEIRTVVNHLNQMTNLLCEEASGSRNEVRILLILKDLQLYNKIVVYIL